MKKIIFTIVSFLFLPLGVFAATYSVEIDTGINQVNALEATMNLPKGIEVKEVHTGSSAIVIWISTPVFNAASSSVSFAGVTPGGFRGKHEVFTFITNGVEATVSQFKFTNVLALKDDGKGTMVPVKLSVKEAEIVEDTFAPESFTPMLSKSKDIFDGNSFVSFSAQDKGTGISKYEVAEKLLFSPQDSDWVEASSPYEVRDRWLVNKVYVRALDASGNYREEVVPLSHRRYLTLILAIIILVTCALIIKRSRRVVL